MSEPNENLPAPAMGSTNANPPGIKFWDLVKEDARTQELGIRSQGFWALYTHRFGNWRMGLPKGFRILGTLFYRFMAKWTQVTCGIDLPYTVKVGRRVRLEHFGGMILIAESIGDDVTIRQNTTFGIKKVDGEHLRPKIGNLVDIGVGAVIIGGVTVGEGATIGANAVVIKDVPVGATAVGVPARILVRA
ncbi:hypothetical protein [Parvularcula sp. LCG005]|uniref:serine O-acetyltransferase n=1 Tax=Parvularcula sp. LCG005 TaxID=3078805 RepID=UPI002943497B|nr:hypothetical protein [Parvularcula sp. LCG005]WOI53343.1 hypothetical protein RUI03_14455 [Parvularcula sp. LCG005]